MHLHFRNVNEAFRSLTQTFYLAQRNNGQAFECPVVLRSSRNGDVLMIEEPVTITYSHPRERVLFNQARDCNPFFHLYEALWMLAGRNDLAPLQYYVSDYGQFSDDGETLNGAYGYRWRHSQVPDHQNWENGDGVDQLDILINHLKAVPNSRRAVLTMWNVEDDLLKIGSTKKYQDFEDWNNQPSEPVSKDVCCNLNVMFALSQPYLNIDPECITSLDSYAKERYALDMTVTNRSNDMILGMLGANYVHFTMLQEYMAARLGVEVGKYHHITNNLHVYEKNWEPEKWLNWNELAGCENGTTDYMRTWNTIPLVKDPAVFEKELPQVVEQFARSNNNQSSSLSVTEPFFKEVAVPAFAAFQRHKERDYQGAEFWLRRIVADDWRIACTQWIEKRKRMYENRGGAPFSQGCGEY